MGTIVGFLKLLPFKSENYYVLISPFSCLLVDFPHSYCFLAFFTRVSGNDLPMQARSSRDERELRSLKKRLDKYSSAKEALSDEFFAELIIESVSGTGM